MKLYLLHGDMSGIHGYRERDCETVGYERMYTEFLIPERKRKKQKKEIYKCFIGLILIKFGLKRLN